MIVTVVVGAAGFFGTWLAELSCIGDSATRYCVETEGGRVPFVEVLFWIGPPIIALVLGVISVRRRRAWPLVSGAVCLVPVAAVLPALLWS